jgi:hypothetical protein
MNRFECYQAASAAFDNWVCNGIVGRAKTDPVYQMVVEGRDKPANYLTYSSCADRAHAKLWRFGCRLPFLNREERSPLPNDFHWGVNISDLHDPNKGSPCLFATQANGKKFSVPPKADWEPTVGDELLLWNTGSDAHSLAIKSFDGSRAVTANYGVTGCSAAVFPGGKLGSAPLVFKSGHWWYGEGVHARQVQSVLRIADYIEVLTAKANLEGIPFDSDYTGEVRDLIEKERA